jgi:hypothetical protein
MSRDPNNADDGKVDAVVSGSRFAERKDEEIDGNTLSENGVVLGKIDGVVCTDVSAPQDAAPAEGEIIDAPLLARGHESTSSKLLSDIPKILTALLDYNARILLARAHLGDPETTSPAMPGAEVRRTSSCGEIFGMDGVKMKTLTEQIEEMRARMIDWAKSEVGLINTLGHSLTEADNKLLDSVRNLSSEHEARRAEISKELQTLAARLGVLPPARDLFPPVADEPPLLTPPFTQPSQSEQARVAVDRRAAASASMADELSKHLVAVRALGR